MKKTNIFLCMFFCVFFSFMMLVFFITPKAEFSQKEKRVLAKPPIFSIETLLDGSFFSKIDDYISDNFVFRDFWVGLNSYYNQYTGAIISNEIYKGKDNWLIEKPIKKNNIFEKNVEVIKDFVSKNKDKNIYFMTVPTKGYIMSDYLPDLHENYADDELMKHLENTISDYTNWIDIMSTFKQNIDKYIYYKTDHHWTSLGAYIAYTRAAKVMGFEPTKKDNYNIKEYEGFYGTSYSKSGFWFTPFDSISLWSEKNKNIKVSIRDENSPKIKTNNSVFFYSHLKETDKYQVFLDGNHAFVNLTTHKANTDKKLLIIRDSFAHCLSPFFLSEYKSIDLVDIRYFKSQTVSNLIEKNNYNDILFVYGLDTISTDRSIQWLK